VSEIALRRLAGFIVLALVIVVGTLLLAFALQAPLSG